MKKLFGLPVIISLAIFCSCQKQQAEEEPKAEIERQVEERLVAQPQAQSERQLAERQAELDAHFARAESRWVNDYKKAQQEATANHKFILLDFTGSDWCGWCRKFDKEIWSQPQFKDYARDNLVLVEVDFPRAKPQTVELRKQNQELARQYEVQGFPTIVVLNDNGEKVWQYDGYFPGGPDAFIAELEKLRKG